MTTDCVERLNQFVREWTLAVYAGTLREVEFLQKVCEVSRALLDAPPGSIVVENKNGESLTAKRLAPWSKPT